MKKLEAQCAAKETKNARWRYAIRNPDFLAELKEAAQLLAEHKAEFRERFDSLLTKWGFHYIGLEILAGLPYLESDPSELTRFLEAYSVLVLSYPVLMKETDNDRIINLEIDVSHPVQLLVPLVEQELREAIEERWEGPQRRQRSDKVDFYLRVYDLAIRRATFTSIAKNLKEPPSTVKSAFLAAKRKIFGATPIPSKTGISLVNFQAEHDCARCPECKDADRFEDMCPKARLYAGQDHRSQRELTRLNTLRDVEQSEDDYDQ